MNNFIALQVNDLIPFFARISCVYIRRRHTHTERDSYYVNCRHKTWPIVSIRQMHSPVELEDDDDDDCETAAMPHRTITKTTATTATVVWCDIKLYGTTAASRIKIF